MSGFVDSLKSFIDIAQSEQARMSRADTYVYNREQLRAAAGMADAQAVDALSRGSIFAGQERRKASGVLAKQNVAFANSGVDQSVGTPASVAASSRLMSEYDVQNIRNNAAREAFGHQQVARKYRGEMQNLGSAYREEQAGADIKEGADVMSFIGNFILGGMSL